MIAKNAIKPFIIFLLFTILVCTYFWMTSRYPDLSGKSSLGTNASTSSIGFAPIIEIEEGMPFWHKVIAETINWIHTNKKGMSFAFVIGAIFLSIWPLIKFRAFKNGIANSALGTILGAPLGVCVNCAAPVARSLHASGSALQTTLSTLVASPTLNLVVLLMAFSVFPFYMAALKLSLTLVFVLMIVPLICHVFFKHETKEQNEQEVCEINHEVQNILPDKLGIVHALIWSVKTYIKNLLYLLKIALPLMLFSGFLGALLTVLIPWEAIETLKEQDNIFIITGYVIIIAFFGALLPSPMAFDVVISAAMLQAGVPAAYVSALLFTLGSFSIYAFFIIWQAISLRVASTMMLITILLGIVAGLVSIPLDQRVRETNTKELMQLIQHENYDPIFARTDKAHSYNSLKPLIQKQAIKYQTLKTDYKNLKIEWTEFKSKTSGDKPFTFQKGEALGMEQPYTISYLTGPSGAVVFSTMSIASGDVHNDGWPDLLIMGDHEVRPNLILYANIKGQTFKRQKIPFPTDAQEVVLVSLADLNADGWLDIVFATLGGKNFVIYNKDGAFLEENLKRLHPKLEGTTMSISYGDIERDGNLDIFLGNWSVGPMFINYSRSRNILLKQSESGDFAQFAQYDVPGPTGETLTSLMTDINKDGILDVYVGNDFIWNSYSDFVLLGTEQGTLIEAGDEINQKLAGGQSTMSIDEGDIDNDLQNEFYIGQIAYAGQYIQEMSKIAEKQISYEAYCNENAPENCQREMKLKFALARASNFVEDACAALDVQEDKKKCLLHLYMYTRCGYNQYAHNDVQKQELEGIIPSQRYSEICEYQDQAMKEKEQGEEKLSIIKTANDSLNNVLLRRQNTSFVDEANERKLGFGAWTWNARWADLDNDGWQDMYIVNGYSMPMALPTNIFYRNTGSGKFEDVTEEFSLESFTPTSAYTYLDIDNDGDLDIVTVPTDAPLEIFVNNVSGNAIQFELRDETSNNLFAIGAEIQIFYKENGQEQQQTQTIKGSGGYKSFNQPITHFGSGTAELIDKVIIIWPDGIENKIDQKIKTGKKYVVTRNYN